MMGIPSEFSEPMTGTKPNRTPSPRWTSWLTCPVRTSMPDTVEKSIEKTTLKMFRLICGIDPG